MLATEYFGISRGEEDDWFDTILDVDTELFVDPFLIFKEEVELPRFGRHFSSGFLNRSRGWFG